jgi:hypothetical protein
MQPHGSNQRVRRMLVVHDDELNYDVRSTKDFVERRYGNGKHAKGALENLLRDTVGDAKAQTC